MLAGGRGGADGRELRGEGVRRAEVLAGDVLGLVGTVASTQCGHCTHLKPEIEKVAPLLGELGVAVGHVGENNQKLVNDFVVDHKTHMVSYPKLFVFLGQENLGQVPGGLRTAAQLYNWFKNEYKLAEAPQGEEL